MAYTQVKRGYSPLASLLMAAAKASPNKTSEEFITSPSNSIMSLLGVPEMINIGVENNSAIPATFLLNAVFDKKLLGKRRNLAALLDAAATYGLAKGGSALTSGLANAGQMSARGTELQSMLSNPIADVIPEIKRLRGLKALDPMQMLNERQAIYAQTRPVDEMANLLKRMRDWKEW